MIFSFPLIFNSVSNVLYNLKRGNFDMDFNLAMKQKRFLAIQRKKFTLTKFGELKANSSTFTNFFFHPKVSTFLSIFG